MKRVIAAFLLAGFLGCRVEETNTEGSGAGGLGGTGGTGGDGGTSAAGTAGFAGSSGFGAGGSGTDGFSGTSGDAGSSGFSGSNGNAGTDGTGGTGGTGPQLFYGTQTNLSATWTSGQRIRIFVQGGDINTQYMLTSINVYSDGEPGVVNAWFTPFEINEDAGQAALEMQENVGLGMAENADGDLEVTVDVTGEHQGSLSAYVTLSLPAEFDGALQAEVTFGNVDVEDMRGTLDVEAPNGGAYVQGAIHGLDVNASGSIYVYLYEPIAADETGTVTSSSDITLVLVSSSDVTIQTPAGSTMSFQPDPLPEGWVASGERGEMKSLIGNNGSSGVAWTLLSDPANRWPVQVNVVSP